MRRLWRPVLDKITPYEAGKPLEALAADLLMERAHVARLNGAVEVARSLAHSASKQYAALGARKGENDAARFLDQLNA